ncbi:putative tyrosinase-like protein tyr-3 [Portunus trituberculatus]|uniref:putative tyrosinase-like protein tyr-3 n=1 Tax=Portunus trituberculatus TaxID=210409 RepID=UPI001E1D0F25|nr:putative tyrosinase-like protein tyr-3 [Portunus trituberculatus]
MALSCLQVSCAAAVAVLLISSVAEGCSDLDQRCEQWAYAGECTTNPGYMKVNCPVSCHMCVVQDRDCQDLNAMCYAWAHNNECKTNYSYMRKACARACSFCQPANDHSVPHVHANKVDSLWEKYQKRHPGMPIRHHG